MGAPGRCLASNSPMRSERPAPAIPPEPARPLSRWAAQAFGGSFDLVYPDRGAAEAEREMAALLDWPEFGPGPERVVDLSCGRGRHVEALVRRGRFALGLDLSRERLAAARRGPDPEACRLVRADRGRCPCVSGAFDLALLLFQSLGYGSPAEDERALQEARRLLRPGGWLVLELLDAERVWRGLVRRSESRRGTARVVQRRRLTGAGSHVVKRVRIRHPDDRDECWTERVRLEGREVHEARLRAGGFEPLGAFGAVDRRAHRPGSDGLWLLARRA